MNTKNIRLVAVFGTFLIVSGCATPIDGENPLTPNVCVRVATISSFDGLSDREVFVTAGVRDYYLFSVIGVCNGLEDATAIAVEDETGRICGDGFGSIFFRDVGLGLQSCRVHTIERVSSIDEARERVTARAAERRGHNKN
ncbi:MAG: hypothetical protein GXP15_05395 [Gammaproteobacteria bacterium]|nr:hypothetical protein [Gammaproteobacteria bacterium]